jgi:hypothetical protein
MMPAKVPNISNADSERLQIAINATNGEGNGTGGGVHCKNE